MVRGEGRGDGDDERIGQRIPWWRLERQEVESEQLEGEAGQGAIGDGSIQAMLLPYTSQKGVKRTKIAPYIERRSRKEIESALCESKRELLRWD